MIEGGVELVVGGIHDDVFGPVVMFGLGGIMVEVYRDVSFRLAPISKEDALEMMEEIKGKKILEGYRGYPPVDKEKIADVIVSVSEIIAENHNIKEMDINPLICRYSEAEAVDVRILLGDD